MKYAYFTGCVAKGTCPELHQSTVELAKVLGIDLWEMTDATCCGAGVIRDENPELQIALNARTFAMAEAAGMDIVNICSTCQQNLGQDNRAMREDPALLERTNEILARNGLHYSGKTQVKNLLWVLVGDYGLDRLKEKVVRPLTGLRVASYYGCQLLRPIEDTGYDDPDNPTSFDNLVRALGGTPVDYAGKTRCCGFHILTVNEDTSTKMAVKRLEEAEEAEADIMVTPCPLCHTSLDAYQPRATKLQGSGVRMPVLHLSQLVGLACGVDVGDLKLNQLMVSPQKALSGIM
jgi:succinate dehydrogenase / fumarate reductase, cytochrome b subunit